MSRIHMIDAVACYERWFELNEERVQLNKDGVDGRHSLPFKMNQIRSEGKN
jgi:hypothetical protein